MIAQDDNGETISRFVRRVLTRPEKAMVQPKLARYLNVSRDEPKQSGVSRDQALRELSQWLAGRFAAKEATKKAYASRQLSWREICVRTSSSGRPFVIISSPAEPARSPVLERIEDERQEQETDIISQVARLSISHDGEYAMAMVMVADQPPGSDGDAIS
ncbi:MAG: hypothetical protein M1816_000028 [Peltula sp. TS41687]|nr:MAG: hypothetical protein M1816_000028 [Peltula sp. TS41687]